MNLQGTPTGPSPATSVPGHGPTPVGHKHHKPVHHDHHVKRTQTPHHRQHPAHQKHPGHKSAPRGSLPVTEMVQAMLWHVSPAAC